MTNVDPWASYTIGSAYTDRLHPGIKEGADEFFGFRAKAYLDIEIDSPTIATAQALLVLSSHEAAHARDSRGWIYSGKSRARQDVLVSESDQSQEWRYKSYPI